MNCDGICTTCETSCLHQCPKCKSRGIEVPALTVYALTKQNIDLNKPYYLCIKSKCEVAYFDDSGNIYTKDLVNVPIWFKSTLREYYVCYCRSITLIDVINAINSLGVNCTKEEIIKYLGKEKIESDCVMHNPTGKSCDKLFDNAIEYAKKAYEKNINEQGDNYAI